MGPLYSSLITQLTASRPLHSLPWYSPPSETAAVPYPPILTSPPRSTPLTIQPEYPFKRVNDHETDVAQIPETRFPSTIPTHKSQGTISTAHTTMCDFELIVYRCKHTDHRRFAWCHHARSEPGHICSGVKALKRVWPAEEDCERCVQQREMLAQQLQQQYQQQQQQQQQGGGMAYPGYQSYRQ